MLSCAVVIGLCRLTCYSIETPGYEVVAAFNFVGPAHHIFDCAGAHLTWILAVHQHASLFQDSYPSFLSEARWFPSFERYRVREANEACILETLRAFA
jgi:hypothetical protein